MAKDQPVIRINLTLRAQKTLQNAFFKWATQAGKLIIIFTELIALSALAYRFYIDRKIIDSKEEIQTEIAFIESQQDREAEFRNIQNRLAHIKSIDDKNQIRFQVVSKVTDAISRGVFSTDNLAINEKRIEFEGSSLSIFSIYNFIEDLKNDQNILAISLDEVTSTSQGIRFTLAIELAIPEENSGSAMKKKEISLPSS
jgi:hypothetical protein